MNTVITIGREYASGGALIAKKLADSLGIPLYDKKLIALAAEETGLSPEFIQSRDEKKTNSFLYNLYYSSINLPANDHVFIAQFHLIKKLADQGPCVIVGRCANYILRDRPDCLHAFVYAPLEERVHRAREEYGIQEENLASFVQRRDKDRAAYYSHLTAGKWSDPHNYDICLNSSLGIDCTAALLADLAKNR